MIVKLHTQKLQTMSEIEAFLEGSQSLEFELTDREDAYRFVAETLRGACYHQCSRREKGLLRRYLMKVTGLSRAQVARLVRQYRQGGEIRDRRGPPARPFLRRYTKADIRLLAELDREHDQLSGAATRKLCERAWHVFGDERYERLAGISNGHLYNLRRSQTYQRHRGYVDKTRSTHVNIGERRPPNTEGQPGFLRVDSVHQGDWDGAKGLYHINLVDEVTQFQFVGSVPQLSERFLLPVLEALIESFPFVIQGFHADNGSEYINHCVVKLLEKLKITEFTKSRARRSHDNALVESKNGSVVRKHLGYHHIPKSFAEQVNEFNQNQLSTYLNFHRPCHFPTETVDTKGRRRKRYRYEDMATPYEKLKSLANAEQYLKPGVTFKQLDEIAYAICDNEAARQLNEARENLFQSIRQSLNPAA
ncbi:integrase [Halorhodospira halochloris]|uniref:integrase n=1 Tax=Halorhodospira halochloris TaxID=1052 RepID=UPI001EE815EE|nr:integrase [Halorhodospira halochloris]MCG5549578.1 integrase [Halorhodospira halochloris]